MDKKERNEEIQSRREFFKNAAKSALPILGVAFLVSNPIVAKASEAMGCSISGCKGTCEHSCDGSCVSECRLACNNRCVNTCEYTCEKSSRPR